MKNFLLGLNDSEPVRLYVYPLLALLIASLVTRGVLDASLADYITAVLATVLGLTAAETARSQVTPMARVAAAITASARTPHPSGSNPAVPYFDSSERADGHDESGRHEQD